MAHYMVQFAYNSNAVAEMVKTPQDRAAAVRAMIDNWDVNLESFYFSFGEYDGIAIVEGPDNVTIASLSMAIASSGAFKSFHTTVLLTSEEAMEAMQKAGNIGFQPPGG